MSNIINNRISHDMSDERRDRVLELFAEITTEMSFLIGLNVKERKTLPKINRSNKLFVEDCVLASERNDTVIPSYISSAELKKDYQLYQQLEPILLVVQELYIKIRDTQMLAGSEAFSSGLMIYQMYKVAANAGLPGAQAIYDNMKERFKSQSVETQEEESGDDTEEAK